MAIASEVITAAYREGNLLSINASPTTAQQTEGLSRLNSLLPSVLGQEVGQELFSLTIGGEYDQGDLLPDYLPENVRLVLNVAGAKTYKLHPNPYDGQRVAIVDAADNLTTYNVTLNGNGRKIEGAATKVLSTNGQTREWFYRADLGDWKPLTSLALTDSIPFPAEFDDYFIILLSMRLNPLYGQELQVTSAQWLQSMASRLEARYRRPRDIQDWGSLGLLGQSEFGRDSVYRRNPLL